MVKVYQVYVDDSTNTDPPIFVLAGYAGTVDQWKSFSEQWYHALGGKPFKMSEANRWQLQRKKEIFPHLYRVIQENVKFGIGIIVDPVALKDERLNEALFGIKSSSPYYFSFFQVMRKILSRHELPGEENKIEFIFDDQMTEKKIIRKLWEDFLKYAPEKAKSRLIAEPQFRNDKDLLPLQAADFGAWWARHNLSEAIKGNAESDIFVKVDKPLLIMRSIWNRDKIIDFKNFLINYNSNVRGNRVGGFNIISGPASIYFGLSRNAD